MTTGDASQPGTASNPRAQRSKTALITAMIRALDEYDPGTGLSIAEISRTAGVSRPTFYQHFGGLPNLIRAAAAVRLVELFERVPQPPTGARQRWHDVSVPALRALLTELERYHGFYVAVLDSTAAGEVREDVIEFLATHIVDVSALGESMKDIESSAQDVRERAMFLAAGALWRTERWLRDDDAEPADQLAQRLSRILASAAGVRDV